MDDYTIEMIAKKLGTNPENIRVFESESELEDFLIEKVRDGEIEAEERGEKFDLDSYYDVLLRNISVVDLDGQVYYVYVV